MMNRGWVHIVFTYTVVFSSCELALDVGDDLDYEDQLVVGAVLQPDSVIKVSVARSEFILERDNSFSQSHLQVRDAAVSVFEDGVLLASSNESVSQEDAAFAIYRFPFLPIEERTYTIEVAREGFPTATATEFLSSQKPMADLNEVDVNISATEEFSQGTVNFSVEIEDQTGDDYFEIVVYSQFDGPVLVETDSGFFYQRDSSVTQTTSLFLNSNSIVFEDYFFDMYVFDDRLFSESNFSIRFSTDFFYEKGDFDPNAKILVVVRRLSEAYFDYLSSSALQWWLEGDPFAEPVQIYSNVENGLGIVGSFNQVVLEIPLE
ncbi:MAG: DUF4249 domain-containing protein [Bacteroidota bacterium]